MVKIIQFIKRFLFGRAWEYDPATFLLTIYSRNDHFTLSIFKSEDLTPAPLIINSDRSIGISGQEGEKFNLHCTTTYDGYNYLQLTKIVPDLEFPERQLLENRGPGVFNVPLELTHDLLLRFTVGEELSLGDGRSTTCYVVEDFTMKIVLVSEV